MSLIAFVDGVVAEVGSSSVTVQVGGFGLTILCPAATLANCSKGEAIRLLTYLAVKEDAMVLYGFHNQDSRTIFTYLISVSGVGPKLALALLSSMPSNLLAGAILSEDAGLLSSAPGVGKKMAERIIVELKNKLPEELSVQMGKSSRRPNAVLSPAAEDAIEALLTLGYRESQVKGTVAQLALQDAEASSESLIRKALAKLR